MAQYSKAVAYYNEDKYDECIELTTKSIGRPTYAPN
jgi:hypothetical protein